MTYHPSDIMVTALYLATKTEHHYMDINLYCAPLGKVTPEDVRAPEFLLMQGLRFSLDVRHSTRSLEGGISDIKLHATSLCRYHGLDKTGIDSRIVKAAEAARRILTTQVQMTDAYFLYTPPQIYLAALMVTDKALMHTDEASTINKDLTTAYIDFLFSRLDTAVGPIKQKLMATVNECADLIRAEISRERDGEGITKELGRIGKKLKKCQDPEKKDIRALSKAKATDKREADAQDEEKVKKKRRLERERAEKEGDVFGPDLKNVEKKG